MNALETLDEESRLSSFAQDWALHYGAQNAEIDLLHALDLPRPFDSDANAAVLNYVLRLGGFAADIVALAPLKGTSDDGFPFSPAFRFAQAGEAAERAIVLPVRAAHGSMALCFDPAGTAEAILDETCDFIAIRAPSTAARSPSPVGDGGGSRRALSFSGLTGAVGEFAADDLGRAVVFGSGRAWLDHALELVRKLAEEFAANPAPSRDSDAPLAALNAGAPRATLLLEPGAFDWTGVLPPLRPYVLPEHCRQLVIPDSRGLAERLAAAMKQTLRRLPRPEIMQPKEK